MVQFTSRCEEAVRSNNLNSFQREMQQQLEAYTMVDMTGSDASFAVLELKLKALILDAIHNIEVIGDLMTSNTHDTIEWLWQKQLRYNILP